MYTKTLFISRLKLGLASKLGIDLIEDLQRPGFYNKALVCKYM